LTSIWKGTQAFSKCASQQRLGGKYATLLDWNSFAFEAIGLVHTTPDDDVWRLCQQRGYYLLTANRNHESDTSLEATIRREGKIDSLPVFTISNAERIYHSPEYLDRTVETLLVYMLDPDRYRGAGRLFLP
jgi:hypothetical protein